MPSKFSSDQGAKVQEYFVYFKLLQRRAGGNLPVDAEAGLISVSLAKERPAQIPAGQREGAQS
jgi:hypothetical protein